MASFTLVPCIDAEAMQRAIASWLEVDPVPFSLLCDVAGRRDAERWSLVLMRDGRPVVAMAQTPPWPVVLASPHPADAEAAQAIAERLRAMQPAVTSVNGPDAWARAIAHAMGGTITGIQGVRLHLLRGSPRSPRAVAGTARRFADAELPLLCAWLGEFTREAAPEAPQSNPSLSAVAAMREQVLAWTIADQPVAMARAQRPFSGGWTIGPVFTPLDQRGRGYGGAVVHAQCTRLIAEGSRYLALYTDLGNATSNRLYARIGFVPHLDQARITWSGT